MTSILSLLQLKGRQAEAATTRGVDVAVTAGAGSGKTRALVGRYLSLLEEGWPLRSLVAITFTEKAAREMRTRIRSTIEQWLAEGVAADRDLWELAFAELDAARIGTIHSLCAAILRAHPAEAGVDPAFTVLEENAAAILKARAVEVALAWAMSDPGAARLFGLLGEYRLRVAVTALLERRLDAAPAFDLVDDELLDLWAGELAAWLEARLGVPAWLDSLDVLGTVQARKPDDKLETARRAVLARWGEVCAAHIEQDWDTVFAGLLALRGSISTSGAKGNWEADDLAAARGAMATLRTHYDGQIAPLVSKKKPVSWILDRQVAEALPDLCRLFKQAVAVYQQLKDEGQALDFDDLEMRAATLLTENPTVRARWQSEVSAVLVDEFQDTNERQRRIVYALTGFSQEARTPRLPARERGLGACPEPSRRGEGGALFVVGDAKQSIYRFRGADVTVFRRVQTDVAAAGGQHTDLDLTFRPHKPLMTVTNALLQPILGAQDDRSAERSRRSPARPYDVPFAPLRAYRQSPAEGIRQPFIELHLGIGEDADEGRRAAAAGLVQRLVELYEDEGIEWGQVALLFRASTHFGEYEDALERAGIPFVTVAGRGFYDRPEVRDLLNALSAIAAPDDDLALAGLLRSPAFGLTDAALYLLRWGQDGERRPMWAALNGDLVSLDPTDAARAEGARKTIAGLHELVGRAPVAEILKRFLDATYYRAALRLSPGGERPRRNVDKLLADAHRSGLVSVGEFLEYVGALRDVAARESEAPVEAGGAVQLMTVHKAKGLEFPVVVIADAAHGGGSARPAILVEADLGVLLDVRQEEVCPAVHQLLALRHSAMEEAEDKRLLYVAATRAREKLLISGHVKLSTAKNDPGRLLLRGWLARLGEVVGLGGVRLPQTPTAPQPLDLNWDGGPLACVLYPPLEELTAGLESVISEVQAAVDSPAAAVLTDVSLPPDLVAPLAFTAHDVTDDKIQDRESDPPPRVWRVVPRAKDPSGPALVVGKLVHEALRRWRFPDGEGFEAFLRPYALEAGLTDETEIGEAIARARRLLARFQAHPLYDEMDAAERYHEAPYSVTLDDGPRSGIIDLLYWTDGRWTIAEFKTDRLKDEAEMRVRIRKEKYDEQVRGYLQAVTQQLEEQPRALLVFLNVGHQVRIVSL
jgi:ATP-dependent helicase/nuclease subunit A